MLSLLLSNNFSNDQRQEIEIDQFTGDDPLSLISGFGLRNGDPMLAEKKVSHGKSKDVSSKCSPGPGWRR